MRLRALLQLIFALLLCSCASSRKQVPVGVVPEQGEILGSDEQYGHEVLDQLTASYPLDRDDARINRVRDIVDRLTKAAKADKNPWHVFVLQGDDIKNAAATRGNYVFVWTGILEATQTDGELATILAHEIGHVLAGHTAEDPTEETTKIIAGIAGAAAGGVVSSRGLGGPASDLAELIVRASLEALLVNPDQQSKELEADQIGIFLMADAAFNPQEAVNFWERVKNSPDFGGAPLEFMSSHPSSSSRLEKLSAHLYEANQRYQKSSGNIKAHYPTPAAKKSSEAPTQPSTNETWIVQENSAKVFAEPFDDARLMQRLKLGSEVRVISIHDRWLEISAPVHGFIKSHQLAPK